MVQGTSNFSGNLFDETFSESAKGVSSAKEGPMCSTPMMCDTKFAQIRDSITASDLKMLLDIVQEMLVRELNVLDNAVASHDVPIAKNSLHKLKGLCGNYGLMVLADEAKDLECVLANDEDEIEDLNLSTFSSYIARSIGELKLAQASL